MNGERARREHQQTAAKAYRTINGKAALSSALIEEPVRRLVYPAKASRKVNRAAPRLNESVCFCRLRVNARRPKPARREGVLFTGNTASGKRFSNQQMVVGE